MFNIFSRLFGKRSKSRSTREIVAEFEQIQIRLEQLGQELSRVTWKQDLVEPARWDAKYKEAMEQGSKAVFHFGSFLTHVRCLHQWQTNTPPTLKPQSEAPIPSGALLADEDLEFLTKLKEAKEWKARQK